VSLDHVVSALILERPFFWLISVMLSDIRVLFNPFAPIQEKIAIAKTWATFLSKVSKIDRVLSPSDLDCPDDEKINAIVEEMIAYIYYQNKYYLEAL